jgi:hypothetical protein
VVAEPDSERDAGSEEPAIPGLVRHRNLREALEQIFLELPWGEFVSWDLFLDRATRGPYNYLLLGRSLEEVSIRYNQGPFPPHEEQVEKLARWVLNIFLHDRLIPFGCVQAALDAERRLLVTRTSRLDLWFGRQPSPANQPVIPSHGRVIVQPDFTIVLIGSNATPTAELSPFCERVQGTVASGSVTFRITRESVVKGVLAGLAPGEILARLERHATTALPGNVVQEIKGWCERIRSVTTESAVLIRCPDRDSADRVQSLLGRKVERLNETILACSAAGLERAERQKLLAEGILLHETAGTATRGKQRARKKG